MASPGFVYLLASKPNGTLYTGVTSDLARRLAEHRAGEAGTFTARYSVYRLVHVEAFSDVRDAIAREKALKKWNRAWKIRMIESSNPSWRDLGLGLSPWGGRSSWHPPTVSENDVLSRPFVRPNP